MQLLAASAKHAAHTQPALRAGLIAPAWRLLHVSQGAILDLSALWQLTCLRMALFRNELKLERTKPHVAQKPVLRGEVCARVGRVCGQTREEVWAGGRVWCKSIW